MKKNRTKRISILLMAISMLLTLCACGTSNQSKVAPEVGYFVFESMEEAGETYTAEYLESFGMDVNAFYIVLEDDGTGYLVIPGEDAEAFTWADNKLKSGNDEIPYTIDGDTLTIADDNANMSFTRSNEEPPAKPTLSSDDEESSSEESTSSETSEAVTSQNADDSVKEDTVASVTEPTSADLGDYHISILSAEQFTDSNDKDSIRFYFDFTNNSDDVKSFYFACTTEAYQEDYELVETYSDFDDAPEIGNSYLYILPGVTIRCVAEYNFKPSGGEIKFTITQGYHGDSMTMTFDPQALTGRPAEDFTIEARNSDQYVENLPSEGVCGEDCYVSITKSEVVDSNKTGEKVIRVYFDFTNNSDEENSFYNLFSLNAMQDGIELGTTWSDDYVTEESNIHSDVQPGETITMAKCFTIHDTGSSVAVMLEDFKSDNDLGTTFEVK